MRLKCHTQPLGKRLVEQNANSSQLQIKENQVTHCAAEAIPLLPETTLVWGAQTEEKNTVPCISKRGAGQLSRTPLTFAEDAQMNQEIGIRRPNAGANAGTAALRPLPRKLGNHTCLVLSTSTDTRLEQTSTQINRQMHEGLPAESEHKNWAVPERLFLYFWDVTPELRRVSLHLLVRGNQPQSAILKKDMDTETSLLS